MSAPVDAIPETMATQEPATQEPAAWLPRRFIDRMGAALVAPRQALAAADLPESGGRSGSDAALLLGMAFVATHTREVVIAGWLAVAEGLIVGLRTLAGSLSSAVGMDLAFVLVAGLVLTVVAGRSRSANRDFDLACVAIVPILAVELLVTLGLQLLGMRATPAVDSVARVTAYGWAGLVLFLAWRTARARLAQELPDAGAVPAMRAMRAMRATPATARRARVAGWLLLVMMAVLLASQSVWVVRNRELLRPVSPGNVAPPVVLPVVDARGSVTSTAVDIAALRGKVVLLDFWATWCQPCLQSMPSIDRMHRKYHGQGLEVISVNTDDPVKARDVLRAMGSDLTLVSDDGTAAHLYRVHSLPHVVLIDRLGVIHDVHRGLGSEAALERAIQELLAPPPP